MNQTTDKPGNADEALAAMLGRAAGVARVTIAIEANKPDAIARLRQDADDFGRPPLQRAGRTERQARDVFLVAAAERLR